MVPYFIYLQMHKCSFERLPVPPSGMFKGRKLPFDLKAKADTASKNVSPTSASCQSIQAEWWLALVLCGWYILNGNILKMHQRSVDSHFPAC